jgi:putative membrane protein
VANFIVSEDKRARFAIIFLAIIYLVGLIGSLSFNPDIIQLTWLNLLLSSVVLFAFHKGKNFYFWLWVAGVFQAGYVLEMFGVKTGRIFGEYIYGNNLGYKINDVPLIIGVNWLMLSYCAYHEASKILEKWKTDNEKMFEYAVVTISALLMVFIDVFIEQVAPQLDFWYWKYQTPPIQNYTAWFIFSFCFVFFYQKLALPKTNPIASWLYLFQLLFFIGINLANYF